MTDVATASWAEKCLLAAIYCERMAKAIQDRINVGDLVGRALTDHENAYNKWRRDFDMYEYMACQAGRGVPEYLEAAETHMRRWDYDGEGGVTPSAYHPLQGLLDT